VEAGKTTDPEDPLTGAKAIAVAAMLAALLPGSAARAETPVKTEAAAKPATVPPNFLRFGAGWYLSPSPNISAGGWQVSVAYHYNVADYALIGPVFTYTGMQGSALLSDLPRYNTIGEKTGLAISQMRAGAKVAFNPAWKISRTKYIWPYGGIEMGVAIECVTDTGSSVIQIKRWSEDFYIMPSIGILIYPRIPFTAFLEAGYNIIPTYAFQDLSFNLYGQPKAAHVSLNTDGFVLQGGLSVNF
jgi:hypothetical protein